MKKAITLAALLAAHSAHAGYAHCYTYNSDKETYYLSGVFYTSEYDGFTLGASSSDGGAFRDEYAPYSSVTCSIRDSRDEAEAALRESYNSLQYQGSASVRRTGWKP